MNTKDNQRARLTKILLKQAYISLMHQKQAARITVKEICESAEINRSTFYLHYAEPNDILIELEDEAIRKVSESLFAIGSSGEKPRDAEEYLLKFLRYVKENDDLFRTFLVENSDPHFKRKLRDVATKMITSSFSVNIPEERKELSYSFLVSGSIDALSDWIKSSYAFSERVVGKTLYALCEGALDAVCKG